MVSGWWVSASTSDYASQARRSGAFRWTELGIGALAPRSMAEGT